MFSAKGHSDECRDANDHKYTRPTTRQGLFQVKLLSLSPIVYLTYLAFSAYLLCIGAFKL